MNKYIFKNNSKFNYTHFKDGDILEVIRGGDIHSKYKNMIRLEDNFQQLVLKEDLIKLEE